MWVNHDKIMHSRSGDGRRPNDDVGQKILNNVGSSRLACLIVNAFLQRVLCSDLILSITFSFSLRLIH